MHQQLTHQLSWSSSSRIQAHTRGTITPRFLFSITRGPHLTPYHVPLLFCLFPPLQLYSLNRFACSPHPGVLSHRRVGSTSCTAHISHPAALCVCCRYCCVFSRPAALWLLLQSQPLRPYGYSPPGHQQHPSTRSEGAELCRHPTPGANKGHSQQKLRPRVLQLPSGSPALQFDQARTFGRAAVAVDLVLYYERHAAVYLQLAAVLVPQDSEDYLGA